MGQVQSCFRPQAAACIEITTCNAATQTDDVAKEKIVKGEVVSCVAKKTELVATPQIVSKRTSTNTKLSYLQAAKKAIGIDITHSNQKELLSATQNLKEDRIKAASILSQLEAPEIEKFQAFLVQFADEDLRSACKRIGIEDVFSAPIEDIIHAIQTRIPSQKDLSILVSAIKNRCYHSKIDQSAYKGFLLPDDAKNERYLKHFYDRLEKNKLMRTKIKSLSICRKSLEVFPSLPNCNVSDVTIFRSESLRHASLQNLNELSTKLKSFSIALSTEKKPLQFLPKMPTLSNISVSISPTMTSLEGIEKAKNTCILFVSGCPELSDVSSLKHLKKLNLVSITEAKKLSSIKGLSGLPHLNKLSLPLCENITRLEMDNLPELRTLDITKTGCRTLEGIEKFPSLTLVSFEDIGNDVDVSALQKLPNLKTVIMAGCRNEQAVGVLSRIKSLRSLDLMQYKASQESLWPLRILEHRLTMFFWTFYKPCNLSTNGSYPTSNQPRELMAIALETYQMESVETSKAWP